MSQATHVPPGQLTRYQSSWRWLDGMMGVFVLIWSAEALVRLPMGWLLTAAVYGYFTLRFTLTAPRFLEALRGNWVMLLYPAICLISVSWSLVPQVSLIAALQIGFTVTLGIFLGTQFGLRSIGIMVLVALGLTMLASLGNLGGALGEAHSYGGEFLGIYTNKNALGQRGALLLAVAIFFVLSEPKGRLRWGALGVGGLTIWLLALSLSATSILASVGIGAFLSVAIAWTRLRAQRAYIALVVAFGALVTAVLLIALKINPVAQVLAAFGKNATLTGRTYLWQVGLDRIADAPLLGYGILGYWNAPEFAQEVQSIGRVYGETIAAFHNFVIEVLVAMGPLGLIAICALIATPLVRLRRVHGTDRILGLTLVALLVVLSLLGSSLFRAHEISLLLVVMIGAASGRAAGSAAPSGAQTHAGTPAPRGR